MSLKIDKKKILKNISIMLYQVRKYMICVDQSIVASEIGITQQQLSAYEQAQKIPSLFTIIALADLYDVSIDYLVGRCQNREAHKTIKVTKYRED